MKPTNKFDAWLFPLFAMPLFVATISTAAANIFGVIFLLTYLASGYWREWRVVLSRTWLWPLLALLAINFLGMLWTQDTARGLELLVKLKWALFTLAGATLPWNRKYFILLVRMFLAGIALNAMIGGLQWLQLYPWKITNPADGPIGYTDRIFLSMTLTSALLWLAYDIKNKVVLPRSWNIALALIFFLQLFSTGGRAGYLSFALLLPIALWMLYSGQWRKWAMAVVMVGVVGLVFSPHMQKRIQEGRTDMQLYQAGNAETSVGLRLVFWQGALIMAKENPVLGVGTGDYKVEMDRLHQIRAIPDTPQFPDTTHPHNSYLAYLADLGLTGLIIFIWFLWTVTQEAWRQREHAAAWFKLSYMGIFLLGSLSDTLIWGFHNAFALGLIVAIPAVLNADSSAPKD
jgi:O-antigen ligase